MASAAKRRKLANAAPEAAMTEMAGLAALLFLESLVNVALGGPFAVAIAPIASPAPTTVDSGPLSDAIGIAK